MQLETKPALISLALGGSAFVGAITSLPLPMGLVGLTIGLLMGVGTATGVYLVLPRVEPVDPKKPQEHKDDISEIAVVPGIDPKDTLEAIKIGREKVRKTLVAAYEINDMTVVGDIHRICMCSTRIIDNFKQDPRDVKAARTWLNQYLDQFHDIVVAYERLTRGIPEDQLQDARTKFKQTLHTIEGSFTSLENKLRANDLDELDVDMQVLRTMLDQEGH